MKTKQLNKPFNSKQFAKDILAKRTSEEISFEAAEKQTGLYRSILYRAEAGNKVSLDVLPVICNWLNVPVAKYFSMLLLAAVLFTSCKKENPAPDNSTLSKVQKVVK